jgi:hypothetical protein
MLGADMWTGILNLLEEMDRCSRADAQRGGLALAFICIDTMSFLAMEDGREEQNRQDFLTWVERYLSTDEDQPYQYLSREVYAARCAILHTCGSEAAAHRRDETLKQFGYTDGSEHMFNLEQAPRLVLISTPRFLRDVKSSITRWEDDWRDGAPLKPKWMRWRTYDRKAAELEALYGCYDRAWLGRVTPLLRRWG